MKNSKKIHSALGLAMLLLFALCITPKLYLHEVFAGHSDVSYCNHDHKISPCLHQQGFNCHLFELVTNSEYLPEPEQADPDFHIFKTFVSFFPDFLLQQNISGTSGRGPPSFV